jgi:hypothetical protein
MRSNGAAPIRSVVELDQLLERDADRVADQIHAVIGTNASRNSDRQTGQGTPKIPSMAPYIRQARRGASNPTTPKELSRARTPISRP